MIKLTEKAKQALNEDIKLKLSLRLGKSYSTIRRWIKSENDKLTTIERIELITELTGLSEAEIFNRS